MTTEKTPQIMELFSKTFPELLDEYERHSAERRENFMGSERTNTLTLGVLVFILVLWFYTFYKLSIHANELPIWFLVLGFLSMFVVPGGFLIVLILIHLMLNRNSSTPSWERSMYSNRSLGYPSRSL